MYRVIRIFLHIEETYLRLFMSTMLLHMELEPFWVDIYDTIDKRSTY